MTTMPLDPTPALSLAFGLAFADLYTTEGALHVDAAFLRELAAADPVLAERLRAARAEPASVVGKAEADLLIAVAPHLEDFLGRLFGIEREVAALQAAQHALTPLFAVK